MAAESSSYPIWFQKGKDVVPLVTGGPLYLVVGDTGRIGDTHKAVANVRERYLLNPEKMQESLNHIEKIATEAKAALMNGDMYLLGKLLDRNQEELINLGVSDDGLNILIEAARKSGALGAKLTGGGLGGCMLALAPSLDKAEIIADELMRSGASKSWYFSTEDDNLYTSQY
jgi:mevalonate kinase